MFDFLKKKISNFVDNIIGKEEPKEGKIVEKEIEEKIEEIPAVEEVPVPKKPEAKKEIPKKEEKKPEPKKEAPKKIEEPKKVEAKPPEKKPEALRKVEVPKPPEKKPEPKIKPEQKKIEPKIEQRIEQRPEIKAEELEVKTPKVSLGIVRAVTSIFSREIEIKEEDVRDTLSALELEMIEGDVAIEIAEQIVADLRSRLVGSKVEKGKLNSFVKQQITETLADAMTTGKEFEILERVAATSKPVKIIFLGINGSGKTTTIAKVATLLMKNGYSVVLAGADTFRAAAIEQLGVHADRLGVKMIKRDYGSDPASVAFDAVTHAKAHGVDVVLIDTAGRQETNINLMNELKKIERVIKPDLRLYVGESIGGSAVIEQVKSFNSEIGVDGIVLTKLDCDAKGGTVISAAKASGVPIVLIGTGQKYDEIESFDARRIISRLMS